MTQEEDEMNDEMVMKVGKRARMRKRGGGRYGLKENDGNGIKRGEKKLRDGRKRKWKEREKIKIGGKFKEGKRGRKEKQE